MRTAAGRLGAMGRVCWGATLLAAPGTVLRGLGGRSSDLAIAVLRVLGSRHLVQGAVTAVRPSGPVRAAGVAADVLHGLTAGLLAALDRHQRGPALAETALAAAWIRTAVSTG